MKKCRVVLFAELDSEQENIISLMAGTEKQLALSDSQLQNIERKLLVQNMKELEEKFPVLKQDKSYVEKRINKENVSCDFVKRLEVHGKERFEVWYQQQNTNLEEHITKRVQKCKIELKLGIKTFFEQSSSNESGTELLVLNIAPKELMNHEAMKKIELYFDTVNHKKDLSQYISIGILPEVRIANNNEPVRERFLGNGTYEKENTIEWEMVENLLNLTGKHRILLCYQYETGREASAEIFAQKGLEQFRENSMSYEKHEYANYISCCYPNLTSPVKERYIGAAFVVAGMLSADMTEGQESLMPKELYPYSVQTREDVTVNRYGSMLCSETAEKGWGAMRHMILLSARTLKYKNGNYQKISDSLWI